MTHTIPVEVDWPVAPSLPDGATKLTQQQWNLRCWLLSVRPHDMGLDKALR